MILVCQETNSDKFEEQELAQKILKMCEDMNWYLPTVKVVAPTSLICNQACSTHCKEARHSI